MPGQNLSFEGKCHTTRHNPVPGIVPTGLNRFAVCSGSRFREQPGFQSNPSLLPPERRCEEEGMLSATQTHLAKELSNDTASTTPDRGHAGEELLTAYTKTPTCNRSRCLHAISVNDRKYWHVRRFAL